MLVLASRSPRRADILQQAGVHFVVDSADIDESPLPKESPRDLVSRLATAKVRAVAQRHPHDVVVLGADTTVDVDGDILGTPHDITEARWMLSRLAGRTHAVHTAVCVGRHDTFTTLTDSANVTMRAFSQAEMEEYLTLGESLDKAGGYAVQGAAAGFVTQVTGEMSTVIGLPTPVVARLLAPLGLWPSPLHP
jgi:septum formation protein